VLEELPKAKDSRQKTEEFVVNVSGEVATYVELADAEFSVPARPSIPRTPAYLPLDYVSDSRQRIETYRKLAQATDKAGLEKIGSEIRDRFGPLPRAVQILLQVAELKVVASDKAVTIIETKEDKLMLTRYEDLVTDGGRLPRLTKKDPVARLKEIKMLLLAL